MSARVALLLIAGVGPLLSCVPAHEASLRADLRAASESWSTGGAGRELPPIDGRLQEYVTYALAHSPELRASYERWRAATLRVSVARVFPDPMVMYGYYARPVQTRVGPQEHRLSVRQDIPWPVQLSAAADAQALEAVASQRLFEARALQIAAEVAQAWWRLWYLRHALAIQREQLEILGGLSESTHAQVAVDAATLAEVGQIDLTRSRVEDQVAATEEQILAAKAALSAAVGVRPGAELPDELPTRGERSAALPAEELAALQEAVRAHPMLDSFAWRAEAERARARSIDAKRLPSFSLGVDWIITDEAITPTQGSGDDAVVVNVGVRVPLWQGAQAEASRAAEAAAEAALLDGLDAEAVALAALDQSLSAVRDSHRRIRLYEDTLLPQAQSVYESVVGAFAVGRGMVAATLLAERDLLEIAVALERAYADHGQAWAQLERIVGRPVERNEAATAHSPLDRTRAEPGVEGVNDEPQSSGANDE